MKSKIVTAGVVGVLDLKGEAVCADDCHQRANIHGILSLIDDHLIDPGCHKRRYAVIRQDATATNFSQNHSVQRHAA